MVRNAYEGSRKENMCRKENPSDHDAGLIPLKGDRKEVELCRRDSDCSIVLRKKVLSMSVVSP